MVLHPLHNSAKQWSHVPMMQSAIHQDSVSLYRVPCPRYRYIATSDSYTHRRPALPALLFQILHLYRMAEPHCNTVI